MKAATGELNLTVITLIAISAVIAFFWLAWPSIKGSISDQWGDISCEERDEDGNCIKAGKHQIQVEGYIVDNYTISFNK